jgi:hypothetical protein
VHTNYFCQTNHIKTHLIYLLLNFIIEMTQYERTRCLRKYYLQIQNQIAIQNKQYGLLLLMDLLILYCSLNIVYACTNCQKHNCMICVLFCFNVQYILSTVHLVCSITKLPNYWSDISLTKSIPFWLSHETSLDMLDVHTS